MKEYLYMTPERAHHYHYLKTTRVTEAWGCHKPTSASACDERASGLLLTEVSCTSLQTLATQQSRRETKDGEKLNLGISRSNMCNLPFTRPPPTPTDPARLLFRLREIPQCTNNFYSNVLLIRQASSGVGAIAAATVAQASTLRRVRLRSHRHHLSIRATNLIEVPRSR